MLTLVPSAPLRLGFTLDAPLTHSFRSSPHSPVRSRASECTWTRGDALVLLALSCADPASLPICSPPDTADIFLKLARAQAWPPLRHPTEVHR